MSLLKWTEREKKVITRHKQGMPQKKIAGEVGMSSRDVCDIIKEFRKNRTELTNELGAVKLFNKGKSLVEVVMKLEISTEEASEYYIKFWDLTHLGEFGNAYQMVKGNLKRLLALCNLMKETGMKTDEIIDAASMVSDLAEMTAKYSSLLDEISKSNSEYAEIEAKKISAYNDLQEAEKKLARINLEIDATTDTKRFVDSPLFKPQVFRRLANYPRF